MSYDKTMNKNSFKGSFKGKRNTQPYDRNQSILSRVKNAVKDYLAPSWMQAGLSSYQERSINQEVVSSNEVILKPSGCIKETSSKLNDLSQALNKDNSDDSTLIFKRRLRKESLDMGLEPQRKRRAIEGDTEFVDVDMSKLSSTSIEASKSLETSNSAFTQSFSTYSRPTPKKTLFSLNHLKIPENSLPISPFYNGPVTYGGANAYQRKTHNSFDGKESEDHQVLISKRQMNMGLSKTTQKILKVLEGNKTQHSDKMGLPPLTIDPDHQKSLTEIFTKNRKFTNGPPVKQMNIPSKLNVKPNYAFVNNSKSGWNGKIQGRKEHDAKEIVETLQNNSYADLSHIKLPAVTLAPLSQPSIKLSCPVSQNSDNFKFSLPRLNQERRNLIGVQNSDLIYTFREPKCKVFQYIQATHEAFQMSPAESLTLSNFEVDFTLAKRKISQDTNGIVVGPAKELKKGSVIDALKKDTFSKITSDLFHNKQNEIPLNELFKQSLDSMWQCSTCMVSNKADLTTCPCCSAVKPTAKIDSESIKYDKYCHDTNSTISSIPHVSSGFNRISSLPSLTTLFAAKPGEWSCEVCMITNKSDATKCAACETAKPESNTKHSSDDLKSPVMLMNSTDNKCKFGTTMLGTNNLMNSMVNDATTSKTCEEPKENLSILFAAKLGEWNCEVCLIRNKSEDIKCVACETNKPGATVGCKENSISYNTQYSSSVVIDTNKGGFSFMSSVPFNASEFGNNSGSGTLTKPNPGIASGGFKPSFGLANAISTTKGFTCSGGGFKFNSSVMCSIPTTQFQRFSSNPSSSPTTSATITTSNLPPSFSFGQVARTSSGDYSSVYCSSTSDSGFKAQENKVPIFQFGLSSGSQNNGSSNNITNTFGAFSSSTVSTFGQNVFSINKSAIMPSSTTLQNNNISTMNSTAIGLNFNTSAIPSFGQNTTMENGVSTFNFVSSSSGLFSSPGVGQSNNLFVLSTCSTGFPGTLTVPTFEKLNDSSGFNFMDAKSNCNGDMVMETPQPPEMIGFCNTTGFSFPNNNLNQVASTNNVPSTKGFSFATIPTFNFSQIAPNFSGTEQTVQQSSSTLPSIPSNNNVTLFSAGSMQGGRVIKKAARRTVKK